MQSGKIKCWYQEKGYGFIEVDNQNEDLFFHVSKMRLSHPISIGQQVYFNSERNAKNQLYHRSHLLFPEYTRGYWRRPSSACIQP